MADATEPAPGTFPPDPPINSVIRDELSAVRKSRAALFAEPGHPVVHAAILLLCIAVNVGYFLYRHDYIALFIAASFYLNMFYFVILLIPQNFRGSGLPAVNLTKFRSWLSGIGLTSGTARFTKLFTNSLFINSRTLSLAVGLIFTIDILLAARAHFTLALPTRTTLVVMAQCAIIVAFYLLVWKLEPFSVKYLQSVEKVKHRLIHEYLPSQLVTVLFIIGFLIAIMLFLTTIILLPGITLKAFLNASQLTDLGNLFSLLAVLAVSQYFIVRYIHGFTSRSMAERLFDYKEYSLTSLQDAVRDGGNAPAFRAEATTQLLESKIYKIRRNTLSGFFPVYVVDLDFSVMLDSTTRTAIRGYIGKA